MRGADPHLLRLPSRPQPANNAASVSPPNEHWHKDTLVYSPGLFLFLLLGVWADENGWEKNAYVFVISQSCVTFRRSEMVSEQDGHPGARGEMESALARVLPASLRTFLFHIRGWLREQAAEIGEESHKMQFMT